MRCQKEHVRAEGCYVRSMFTAQASRSFSALRRELQLKLVPVIGEQLIDEAVLFFPESASAYDQRHWFVAAGAVAQRRRSLAGAPVRSCYH